jgi:hypothetical protein
VGYTNTASGAAWSARLIGIAPRASCAAAADPAVAAILARSGCRTVLRATYADVSGTLVATAGIAVMPSAAAAASAQNAIQMTIQGGVRAIAFPGTAAVLFRDRC